MDGWHRASPATGDDPDAAGLAEEQSAERRHRASVSAAEDKLEEARARHGWDLAQAQRLHDAHCRVIADVRRWQLRLDFGLACVVHHAQQERAAFRSRQEGVLLLEQFATRVFEQPATVSGKLTKHLYACLSAAAHLGRADRSLLVHLLQKGMYAPLQPTIESLDAWARGEREPEPARHARCEQIRLLVLREAPVLSSEVELATRLHGPEDAEGAPTTAVAERKRRVRIKPACKEEPSSQARAGGKRRRDRVLSANESAVRARVGEIFRDWPSMASAEEVQGMLSACAEALRV